MSQNRPLYRYIGDPVRILGPSTLSSDGTGSTTIGSVGIGGYDGVLFCLLYGATDANAAFTIQLQYSSTGATSDNATSNAGMTCTDAIFTTSIHVTANQVHLLDFDVAAKGMADVGGVIGATIAAAETGAAAVSLIAIPYGGTRLYPATNAQTVIVARA